MPSKKPNNTTWTAPKLKRIAASLAEMPGSGSATEGKSSGGAAS